MNNFLKPIFSKVITGGKGVYFLKDLVNFFGFIYPPYLGCGGYTIRATVVHCISLVNIRFSYINLNRGNAVNKIHVVSKSFSIYYMWEICSIELNLYVIKLTSYLFRLSPTFKIFVNNFYYNANQLISLLLYVK